MAFTSDLIVSYSFEASEEDLSQLAHIQVDALWKRHLQDEDAVYKDDLAMTAFQVSEFLERNPDYLIVIAHAATAESPDHKKVIGYNLAAPYYDQPEKLNIDQFYTLPVVSFKNVSYETKPYHVGQTLLKKMVEQAENCADIIDTFPLHGSEKAYYKQGFAKDESNVMLVKHLRPEYA